MWKGIDVARNAKEDWSYIEKLNWTSDLSKKRNMEIPYVKFCAVFSFLLLYIIRNCHEKDGRKNWLFAKAFRINRVRYPDPSYGVEILSSTNRAL